MVDVTAPILDGITSHDQERRPLNFSEISIARVESPFGKIPEDSELFSSASAQAYEMTKQMGMLLDKDHFDETVSMSMNLWPYTDKDRLALMMVFNAVGFNFDDTMGHDKHNIEQQFDKLGFVSRLRRVVADPSSGAELMQEAAASVKESHLALAAMKFFNMVEAKSNPDFARRFIQSTLIHWEVSFEIDDFTPDSLDQFIAIRRKTSGMEPTRDLIEMASDSYLPDEIKDKVEGLREAMEALDDIGGLSNELSSYPKEVITQGAKLNFVAVIQSLKGLDAYEATRFGMKFIGYRHAEFNRLIAQIKQNGYDQIPSEYHDALSNYLIGMEQMVWASYEWQANRTVRYKHPEHIFEDLRSDERKYKE